jgi:hypothetical protein
MLNFSTLKTTPGSGPANVHIMVLILASFGRYGNIELLSGQPTAILETYVVLRLAIHALPADVGIDVFTLHTTARAIRGRSPTSIRHITADGSANETLSASARRTQEFCHANGPGNLAAGQEDTDIDMVKNYLPVRPQNSESINTVVASSIAHTDGSKFTGNSVSVISGVAGTGKTATGVCACSIDITVMAASFTRALVRVR